MDNRVKFKLPRLVSSKTSMNFKEYCRQRLNCEERLMYYRMKTGKIPLKDIHTIMKDTGCTFEDLFIDLIENDN